ncbi:MAG: NHL repeat-containing protein [Pseudomonadota bacterium]
MTNKTKLALAGVAIAAALAAAFYLKQPRGVPPAQPAQAELPAAPTNTAATRQFWTARLSTLAGGGSAGMADGAPGAARFSDPYGVVLDAAGNIYVSDAGDNNRIRKITPAGASSTLAGANEGFKDGAGAQAAFNTPSGIAIDRHGNLYVADTGNHAIRKVTPDGRVSTLAGDGIAGNADGKGKQARFNGPVGVAVDKDDVVYVADTYNDVIRRIAQDGSVTTIAGSGTPGKVDGHALQAQFDTPCALALDADGALLVADTRNNAIRKLGLDGMVTTVVSAPEGERRPMLRRPLALARTHDGYLYIVNGGNGYVLQLTPQGELGALVDADTPAEPGYGSDGKVQLYAPRGVALARDGSLLVTDAQTFRLHRVAEGQPAAAPAVAAAPGAQKPPQRIAAALPLAAAQAAPVARAPQRMLWPVAPQDAPHEVVGLMGEVRGNFEGDSRDHFHNGLDVQAKIGQPVLAVVPAKVGDPVANWGFGSLSEGISLGMMSYIHMRVGRDSGNRALDPRFIMLNNAAGKPERVRVRRGTRFKVGDALGTINAMAHVHLDYLQDGMLRNPLTLPFIGLRDTVPPRISSITLFDASGRMVRAAKRKPLTVRRESGDLNIVVDAYDQMDGNEARRRLGIYRLGYQLLRADGSPVPGDEQPRITQVYDQLPRNRDAVKYVYAPNSGITVYGSKSTRFAYALNNGMRDGRVTPGAWHVADLAPGQYILRIFAADYAGNVATEGRDLALMVE